MEYPKSEVFEKAYIVKLFHNPRLHPELDSIAPSVFLDRNRRTIVYLMKRLLENKLPITLSNMVMYCSAPDEHFLSFLRKTFRCKYGEEGKYLPSEGLMSDILYDPEIESSDKLFDEAKEELRILTLTRFVTSSLDDMKYHNSFYNRDHQREIVSRAKAIQTVHRLLFSTNGKHRNQLSETKEQINSTDEYISTSSRALNSRIGGTTRGFVDAIIGKSGHGKSTWVDYNIVHTILANKVSKITKITPEEPASFTWRRVFSNLCKLSTTRMRHKLLQITDEDVKRVEGLLKDRLIIFDNVYKLKDIMEIIRMAEGDQIYLDHLQSIDYPGGGSPLNNMIGNIPGLILFEERIAKQKNISIINLSQVGDKEIARSERLSKRPRYHDAYGSSVLYQKAREFLAVYYPFRDYDEHPYMFRDRPPTDRDYEIGIEKSSFSSLGIVPMNFDYEFSVFSDVTEGKTKTDYTAPAENQMGMFET